MKTELIHLKVFNSSEQEVGYALGSLWKKTLEIGGIWVSPRYRRAGIGSRLLNGLLQSGEELGAKKIYGRILPDPGITDDQITNFYQRNNLSVDEDGRISGEL